MKKIISILLTCLTIMQIFTFSGFALDKASATNEIIDILSADYSSVNSIMNYQVSKNEKVIANAKEDKIVVKNNFFNDVAQFFKNIFNAIKNFFNLIGNLFKKPKEEPIEYLEPYPDPDPTGEHIREDKYLEHEPYNKTDEKKGIKPMIKLAPWVEPEYCKGSTCMTYNDKIIHLDTTEDYLLYTFGKPNKTFTYYFGANNGRVQRIHVYYDSSYKNVFIFTVEEFTMHTSLETYGTKIGDANFVIENIKRMYSECEEPLPEIYSNANIEIFKRLQTQVTGIYTNSVDAVFTDSGLLKHTYKKQSSKATLNSYYSEFETKKTETLFGIDELQFHLSKGNITNELIVKGDKAEVNLFNNDVLKIIPVEKYNMYVNKNLSADAIGNNMVVEYYKSSSSEKISGISITSSSASICGGRGFDDILYWYTESDNGYSEFNKYFGKLFIDMENAVNNNPVNIDYSDQMITDKYNDVKNQLSK